MVRRVRPRLGSQHGGPGHFGSLVSRRESSVHKCQRTSGSREGSVVVFPSSSRSFGCIFLRQHDSVELPSSSRGHSVSSVELDRSANSSLGRGRGGVAFSPVCDGEKQRSLGFSFSSGPDNRFGMDLTSGSVRLSSQEVAGDGGLVCHLTKSLFTCVFCSDVGPKGSCDGRHVAHLGPSSGVCLSPAGRDKSSVVEDRVLCGSSGNADSSSLAIQGVVYRPRSAFGTSETIASSMGSSSSATREEVSPAPVVTSSSCVETLQRFARAARFSSGVARQLSRSRRSSSLAVYQSKWLVYRRRCREKGHSISSAAITKIADFFLWLWRSKGFSLSAVKSHRSMLSAVFALKLLFDWGAFGSMQLRDHVFLLAVRLGI